MSVRAVGAARTLACGVIALALLPALAVADSRPGQSPPRPASAAEARQAPTAAKVLAWRAHGVCPMGGQKRGVHMLTSVQEWQKTITQAETGALGRRVQWGRERVLVYALDGKPQLGTRLESPGSLRISGGVLWWPIVLRTPEPGTMMATALSRPCVIAAVPRRGWQRVRVLERRAD
jgi:hypothetical protein